MVEIFEFSLVHSNHQKVVIFCGCSLGLFFFNYRDLMTKVVGLNRGKVCVFRRNFRKSGYFLVSSRLMPEWQLPSFCPMPAIQNYVWAELVKTRIGKDGLISIKQSINQSSKQSNIADIKIYNEKMLIRIY